MKLKKILCVAMAAVMLGAFCLSGCSTPRVAMTVDGKEYTTGEYLAYLYNAYLQVYSQQLYYYASSGSYTEDQIWEMTFPYGEGDDEVELELAEYLKKTAQDTIVRQKALENMMEKYDISISDEDKAEMEKQLDGLTDDSVLPMGFNAEHYRSMYQAVNYNEQTLFYGLYDVGGKEGMTEDEMRDYFDKNYYSYKAITISLVDDDGEALSDEEIEKVRTRLEGYLEQYNKSKDFDAVIEEYEADEAAATSTSGSSTTSTTTTASTTSTTTSTPSTTSTTAASKDASASSTGSTTTTTTTDPNLHNIEGAESYSDEDFLKALQSVDEGSAEIVEYKANGTTDTMALILRLDPEKANGDNYYENSHDGIIYNAKYESFNDMVETTADGLTVEINDRAIDMCDPRELVSAQ